MHPLIEAAIEKAGGKAGRAHWNGGRPRSKASHREFKARLQGAQDRHGHLETGEEPGTARIRRALEARIVAGNLRRMKAGGPVKKAKDPKHAKSPGVLRRAPAVARLGLSNNRIARRLAAAEERAKAKKEKQGPVEKGGLMRSKLRGGAKGLLRDLKRMQGRTGNSYRKAERVKHLISVLSTRVARAGATRFNAGARA